MYKFGVNIILNIFIFVILIINFVACGESKIDTSTSEKISASVEKIYNSIPEIDRNEFCKNLNIAMYDIKLIKIFEYEQINFDCKPTINYFNKLIKQGQKNEIDNITKNINGLTNNEIILKAQNKLKN